ncbi:helix-turn-helix domain-containing protein [Aminicella lysinilytica]|uniref:helix-turn-helix domain-containing protein n=1 Tax=Aminicella lysinilytica TaxID=433323 RepID=UPI0026EADB52|nr:helix-turn-helix transcriptional regulator [Aminicella lysinilytica]
MILADKIIKLRKKCGWSQEELANKLDVSRQAVSKWESGNSIPDMEKIVNMSDLFGVSTDFLLKDEIEMETPSETRDSEDNNRSVSVEEANGFMDMTEAFSRKTALAVQTFVLSPVCLVVLAAFTESRKYHMSDNMATGIGMVVLLIMVACGVGALIGMDFQLKPYEYIKKDNITLQYGVRGIVEKRRSEFAATYRKGITTGVILCIVSVVPLMLSTIKDSDPLTTACVGILLIFVSFGVNIFVRVGTIESSYKALMQEEDFTQEAKDTEKKLQFFPGIYWCSATAIYLAISFGFDSWDRSWIIWPVAGVLFAAIRGIMVMKIRSENRRNR